MKLSVALAGAVLIVGIGTSAMAQDCSRPPMPDVPQGASASEEEMIQGQQAVRDFVSSTETFIECLNAYEKRNKDKMSVEDRQNFVLRHNAAVDDMERVAEQFNQAVREYRTALEQN